MVMLLFASVFGQTESIIKNAKANQNEREMTLKYSEFVFEGVIQKFDIYLRKDSHDLEYTASSLLVKVAKVYRGNGKIRKGNVEIVDRGRYCLINGQKRETSKRDSGMIFIFFCREASEFPYDRLYNLDSVDNKTILTEFLYSEWGIDLNSYDSKKLNLDFESRTEIYEYLKTLPDMDIVAIDQQEQQASQDSFNRLKSLPDSDLGPRSLWRDLSIDQTDSLIKIKFSHIKTFPAPDAEWMYKINHGGYNKKDSMERINQKM